MANVEYVTTITVTETYKVYIKAIDYDDAREQILNISEDCEPWESLGYLQKLTGYDVEVDHAIIELKDGDE